jgi:hypothetical protein
MVKRILIMEIEEIVVGALVVIAATSYGALAAYTILT